MTTRLGIIGTSWWVDAMYLPALSTLPDVAVTCIAGRNPERAAARATQWSIPHWFTDWRQMIDQAELDGVIIAAANPVHYPATKTALEAGIHVLCEKPIADDHGQAAALAELAHGQRAVTMVPFTYRFMPGFRWLERLMADGYVGELHHVGLRYHTGYGLPSEYLWKLDADANPTGALGDIGSHFLYLALCIGGPVDAVTARMDVVGDHPGARPDGSSYVVATDSAVVILEFRSGAQGILHASSVAYEGTSMDQRHVIEIHGSGGVLRYVVDWDEVQEVRGARVGEGPPQLLPIPDDLWGGVRRGRVHDTYRDVFRTTDAMARGWARAIPEGKAVRPDLGDGAAVQQLLDACLASSQAGQRVAIEGTWAV